MNLRGWLSAGSAGSLVVGLILCLGLVSAGVTREAPIGQVKGKVTMLENGKPLPDCEIVLRPALDSTINANAAREPGLPRYRYARTEDDGTFSVTSVAAGKYLVEAYAQAHTIEPQQVEVVEGRVNQIDLALPPRDPYLDLYASNHVFQPSEPIKWDLHGFVDKDQVVTEVFKLHFDAVIREGTLYSALAPLARRNGNAVDPATLGTRVSKVEERIKGRDVEGTFRLNLSQEPLPEGLYWIRCTIGKLSQGTYVSVSNVGLVLKRSGRECMAFLAKLDSGAPVPGGQVGYSKKGQFISTGTTNSSGISRFTLAGDLPERNSVVIARHGDSAAFVDFYNSAPDREPGTIAIYSDRPVYRPGDTISYKGIVRKLNGSNYEVPSSGNVEIEVRDGDENLIENQTVPLSGMGTFSGTFRTNREAAPGMFRVSASIGNLEGEKGIAVAAYRKPNYSVTVRPEKDHYIRGEKVRMIVECQYYFGGPVGGAKIEGSVFQAPAYDYYDPDDAYAEEYDDYGSSYSGEYFTDVEGVTDSSGKAIIEFDTRLDKETKESWTDSKFTLNASVADESGAYFEGSGSVKVSAGDFSLISETDRYVVEKGQPFEVTFKTMDPIQNKPVSGKKIRIVAGYEFWDGATTKFTQFADKTLTTGADGQSTVIVTPEKGGNIVIRATAEDQHGNEIKTESWTWCSSSGPSYETKYVDPLSLKLDKKDYAPGEKAKALILCEEPGATAWLTVEADKIYMSKLVKLESNMTTVELPVLPEYAPNVFVSVCYVQDKEFRSRQKRLVVDLGKRKLDVAVKADKDSYKPGETATYRIQTRNESGKGTSAEVSLSVVDEAIYAIREDDTNLESDFYPKRTNQVETEYSFTTLYLDGGDKAPPEMEIRKDFRDTAFWQPAVLTDSSGNATVRVKLPDNVTTWRATVQAVDRSTAVGEAITKSLARKPLMVRVQTPAFYVAGDTQRVSASVTNQTGADATVNVELDASSATTQDAKRQSIRVANGETKAVEWEITVPNPGEVVYTARSWIDSATTDGVEGRVRVLPRGRREVSSYSGEIFQSPQLRFEISPNADRTTGGVAISLTPNLAAPLFQSMDSLIDYPYGCVEQTMSRFMPATVVSKVVQSLGLPKPRRAGEIPAIAEQSFARLKRFRNYEGGWGWWENDTPDTRMTAYVLEGLYRAQESGYPNPIDLASTFKWAEKRLGEIVTLDPKQGWDYRYREGERVYLAYALTLWKKPEGVGAFMEKVDLGVLDSNALALAVMTFHNLGPSYVSKRDAAIARLKGLALKDSANLVYWKETYWGIETTSRCLQALTAVEPQSEMIPAVIRYMLLQRRGDAWSSTQDTAIGLLAISDYLKATNARFGDTTVQIEVNGTPLTAVALTAASIAQADKRIEIPMRLLHSGENMIEFRKSGEGTCYYSAELVQTVVDASLPAYSNLSGVQIERSYHRLEQQPLENGRMQLAPSPEAVSTFAPGDLVRCVVKITTEHPMRYLLVEDPIPSNCRVVERENFDIGSDWSYWWISLVVRDDRIAYFARQVDKGTFEVSYTMRAEQPGTSSAVPASVCEMYEPSKRAWTGVNRLEVSR